MSTPHRIPFTDFSQSTDPVAFVLEVTAEDSSKAYAIASGIQNPVTGPFPDGVRKLAMRFEEIMPFIRLAKPVRRRSWRKSQVLRASPKTSRLDLYDRDIHDVRARHAWVESWVPSTIGTDLLAEDWEIVACPEDIPPGAS
jgi:hypothetical protein